MVKRVLPVGAAIVAAAVIASTASAGLSQPSRDGSATHSRTVLGHCAVHKQGRRGSQLRVTCYGHSAATLRYRFTVPRHARGIVSSARYTWAGHGLTRHLSRAGRHVTVSITVPPSSGVQIARVWLGFYR